MVLALTCHALRDVAQKKSDVNVWSIKLDHKCGDPYRRGASLAEHQPS